MTAGEQLFIGVFSTGIAYADRTIERHGDYKKLAFLPFNTLELMIEKDCPADLRVLIVADAAAIQARRGDTQGALTAYGHAVALSPESGLYRLNLAILQDRAGMAQDAALSYAKALQSLDGNDTLPIPVDQVRARLRYLQSR